MTETSGEDYLHQLETSSDPTDRALAKKLRDANSLTVVPSPLDKAKPKVTPPTQTTINEVVLPVSSKQPRRNPYGR